MRVVCNTISEFIEDLERNEPGSVFQRTVRISRSERPLEEGRDCARYAVGLQVSAVVAVDGGGEYLLEAGVYCGIDYRDASRESAGSEKAGRLERIIREHCDAAGLKVGPGVIVP